jgi:hypothetical protein
LVYVFRAIKVSTTFRSTLAACLSTGAFLRLF